MAVSTQHEKYNLDLMIEYTDNILIHISKE